MSQPKIISGALGQVLKAAGFKKKSDTWYRSSADVIAVLNLQKSNYGQQFYINVALWLRTLGDVNAPPENQCHIRCRLSDVVEEDKKQIARLLDLEDVSTSDEDRSAQIRSLVERHVIPFFSRTATIDGLKTAYRTEAWFRPFAIAKACAVLEEDPSSVGHASAFQNCREHKLNAPARACRVDKKVRASDASTAA